MKLEPGSPPTKIAELIVQGTNIPRGMDRAWAKVPLLSLAPHWDMFCPCTTNSTKSEGMLPAVSITMQRINVCICNDEVYDRPFTFWTGYCSRCNVVYWSSP